MAVIGTIAKDEMTAAVVHNPLEQFVLLAKGAKGAACLELIKQVLEAPGVHVFGELLAMPNIKEVQISARNILNIFVYTFFSLFLN